MSDSLENLYRQHRQGLYSFALSLTGSSQLAEDAIHNAFEGFYRRGFPTGCVDRVSNLESNGEVIRNRSLERNGHVDQTNREQPSNQRDIVAYLFRSVRNSAIDLCRADQRRQTLSQVLFERHRGSENSMPEEELMAREREIILRDAIDQLPEQDQQAVVLKAFAGLTFDQAAEVLEAPAKTIATRYRRALAKLQNHLKGKL